MAAGDCKATQGFVIAVIIISALMVALFIANVIYYNKLRANGGGGGITATQARNLMALNAVWVALAGIVFIWGIIFVALGRKNYENLKAKAAVKLQNVEDTGLLGLNIGSVGQPGVVVQ